MPKNVNYVSHKKSKQKNQDGSPKLPVASALVEGEIAINFAENVETISILNESGHVVTFSSDNYYSEKKLGSAFTGANSAVTVTEALENIEIDVDQVIDSGTSASTNAVATKAVYDAIVDNELVWTNAYVAMSGAVSAHTANTEIHVTAADKEKLHTHSNKTYLDSITGNVGTMAYEDKTSYSSATEVNTAIEANADNIVALGAKVTANETAIANNTTAIEANATNIAAHTADTSIHVTQALLDRIAYLENKVIYNGHEYVDLGLPSGTKWATMNVGASSETDYGNYYQYGKGAAQYAATSGDSNYSGTEDPLDSSVDTAVQVWGGSWHMPTREQMQELTANTTYQWVTNYKGSGINGGTFTATNGAVLFIPAAGYWGSGSQSSVGNGGNYWGSSPNGSDGADGLGFYDGSKVVYGSGRKYGYAVRPVVG